MYEKVMMVAFWQKKQMPSFHCFSAIFVAHHIIDHSKFLDFNWCSQSAVLHITSEIILNFWTSSAAVHSVLCCISHQRSSWISGLLQLPFTVCCVAHHIRDHSKFLDFNCCSQSAVLHITSEIILNFWTSSAVHSLLCCTSHQRLSWISGLFQHCSQIIKEHSLLKMISVTVLYVGDPVFKITLQRLVVLMRPLCVFLTNIGMMN